MASVIKVFILTCALVSLAKTVPTNFNVGPKKLQGHSPGKQLHRVNKASTVQKPKPEDNNLWKSGSLFQGDIMIGMFEGRMGLQDEERRWPDGVIPYYINENEFTQEEVAKILAAMETYHQYTCIKFRPYQVGDENCIILSSAREGCWSYVGDLKQGSQLVNLQSPGCLQEHGVIVHELMHAIGFYHQQSSSDRDHYVDIVAENIEANQTHNFVKYDQNVVSDFGYGYDYDSIMHYDSLSFSKNGRQTIVAKRRGVAIGQRQNLSKKDILKINAMYKSECGNRKKQNNYRPETNEILTSGICHGEGYFADPQNPAYFYKCSFENGRFKEQPFTCPAGMVFDSSIRTCRWR